MSEKTENKENTEDKIVGATESRLLQAMSVSARRAIRVIAMAGNTYFFMIIVTL